MSDKLKAFCNRCNTTTNHAIKCEHRVQDFSEDFIDGALGKVLIGTYHYQIIECNGCESISFRSVDYFPDYMEFDKEKEHFFLGSKSIEAFYPERLKNMLPEKRIAGLPFLLRKAYREVIDSYNYDQLILCAGGLRAIVEGICAHFNIEAKFLKARIDKLGENGLIGKELAESLKIHKFLGDFALHRLEIPEKGELESAINLIELSFESLFGVPVRHHNLKESITKRVSEKK
jgi:hypothetical protein